MQLGKGCLLLIAVIVGSSVATAQTSGTIVGRISGSTGGVVVGATVTARNLGTAQVQTAVTNREGSYVIPSLPPGSYKIAVEASGFKTFAQSGITLQVNENVRADATLQVGSTCENISVSADALHVDTEEATVGISVGSQRLTEMPLNGRNALNPAQLMPGRHDLSCSFADFAIFGGQGIGRPPNRDAGGVNNPMRLA
jgi:hypothetical protein